MGTCAALHCCMYKDKVVSKENILRIGIHVRKLVNVQFEFILTFCLRRLAG
jgi:hypothetical protein